MRRAPVSVVVALRDLVALGAVGFGLGTVVAALSVRRGLLAFAEEYGYESTPFSWRTTVSLSQSWTVSWTVVLLVWAFAVWCATRARAGGRTVWLPFALATVGVAAVAATNLALAPYSLWNFGWPWPDVPLRWRRDGTVAFDPTHPAWAFLVLVVVLLGVAALLGARAGRRGDDAAARRVETPTRTGLAVVAVVVALPAVTGTAGAVVAYLARGGPDDAGAEAVPGVLSRLMLPLAFGVVAAALLSGTGPLGVLATLLVAGPLVTTPVSDWLAGRAGDAALAQAGAGAVVVLAVALWRPCATWSARALAPVRSVPTAPPAVLRPDDAAAPRA